MVDLIAYCTPLLAVLLFLFCLLLGGILISEELSKEFNEVFQAINGENE